MAGVVVAAAAAGLIHGGNLRSVSLPWSQEREVLRLQQDIKQQVDEKMTSQKRTYFLQEQLKSIKKELGLEKDDKEAILNKFRERRKSIKVCVIICYLLLILPLFTAV